MICVVMPERSFIKIDPEIQGGTPCFAGTRVPVKSLFDALDRGRSVDYFLEQFPSVRREQVSAVLREAERLLVNTPPQAPSAA
jgi:uncharacterized protein (DUF433 family)